MAPERNSPIVREVAWMSGSMSSPVVAIVSNSLTPYRLHFHRRLVREVPGIVWHSLFTHDVSNAPWTLDEEAETRPVRFGPGEKADDQSRWTRAIHEFHKGGRIIQWLIDNNAKAMILLGYNDAGRLRIIRWCRRHHVPCFLFGDSNSRGDRAGRLKRIILPRILNQVSGALACGTLGREYFRRYGVPNDRIFYMPYEPDYAMIASVTDLEVAECYRRRNIPIAHNYLVYCGRLASIKRVDLLIDAFAAIAALRPDWDLLLVGDGPLRSELENQVPSALRSRVCWLGFIDDQREIARLLRGGKVLVLPSDDEPWGVAINEAVAAGLAVVTTNVVGAAAELVCDGINGRLFPPGDRLAFGDVLLDATSPGMLTKYQTASLEILARWRQLADPVAGALAALATVGVRPTR